MIFAATLIPPVLVLPAAAAMLLVIAAHADATRRSRNPPSRKRIRIANAVIATFAVPLLAIGFSVVDPAQRPGTWVIVWIAAIALLSMNILLAVLDITNTARLHRLQRTALRRKLGMSAAEFAALKAKTRACASRTRAPAPGDDDAGA